MKKSKVAGNLLHVSHYGGGGGISYIPNVERMVEQRTNCCLSVLKSGPISSVSWSREKRY